MTGPLTGLASLMYVVGFGAVAIITPGLRPGLSIGILTTSAFLAGLSGKRIIYQSQYTASIGSA